MTATWVAGACKSLFFSCESIDEDVENDFWSVMGRKGAEDPPI